MYDVLKPDFRSKIHSLSNITKLLNRQTGFYTTEQRLQLGQMFSPFVKFYSAKANKFHLFKALSEIPETHPDDVIV